MTQTTTKTTNVRNEMKNIWDFMVDEHSHTLLFRSERGPELAEANPLRFDNFTLFNEYMAGYFTDVNHQQKGFAHEYLNWVVDKVEQKGHSTVVMIHDTKRQYYDD